MKILKQVNQTFKAFQNLFSRKLFARQKEGYLIISSTERNFTATNVRFNIPLH